MSFTRIDSDELDRMGEKEASLQQRLTRSQRERDELHRALWAVRVLDAWALQSEEYAPNPGMWEPGVWAVRFPRYTKWSGHACRGPTPDAARLAAAEAVFPELPADVRERLGVRP